MSEIKGQLLGVVLVLAIFGIVAGALTLAFTNVSEKVSDQLETAGDATQVPVNEPSEANSAFADLKIETFHM